MANKIFTVVGPHEGVGKTTLAAHLAACHSQARHQPVVVIDTDPFCRNNVATLIGATSSLSVIEIIEQLASRQLSLPMLRGRVTLNRQGIGVMPLAPQAKDAERITLEQWAYFLEAFSQVYDVVVDMESTHRLRQRGFDASDAVLWMIAPTAPSVRATLQQLEALQAQKFGFKRFLFVLNQLGQPYSLEADAVSQALSRFDKHVNFELPFEPELLKLVNAGRPGLLEQARAPYFQGVAAVLEEASRHKRETGATIHVPTGLRSGKGGAVAAMQQTVANSMLEERRKHWNATKQRLHRDLVEELNIRRIDLDTKGDPIRERQLRTNVESTVNALIAKDSELALSRDERERLTKDLVDEALGLGPLEELLADASITEIMVNRFDQVYIERRGKILLSDKRFIDNNHVVQVIRRIIAPLGRRIDESVPMVDARLRDGSRVNAIIPPLAVGGPTITIRRFPERAFTSDDLIRFEAISRPMIEFLKICVQLRKNIIISGGTGTGKTTILNLLSSFIPNDERIVTVEDTAELRLQQEHIVRLEARPANIEGQGQVTIRDLVKNCLRMRPDRIVIGECRGGEALDMLQAMNTGHEGSLTTIHANTPRDAFTRLETLCLMAGMDLPVWALREQIRSAVHIVVQLSRLQDGSRKVVGITEVTGRSDDHIESHDLFQFVQTGVDGQGRVLGHHEATGKFPLFYPELKAKGLTLGANVFEKGAA